MSPQFTINFRREAYRQEIARARRRVIALGVWVAYFGMIVILVGLYGLNCAALSRRVRQIERQTTQLRGAQGASMDWTVRQAELKEIERFVQNPRRWRDRLTRLATLMPPSARLTSLAVNPQNLTGLAEQDKLVITGVLRGAPNRDRVQDVMQVVSRLRADSAFAAGYGSIRLASTRVIEGETATAEFIIECR